MTTNITINETVLQGLHDFMFCDEKKNIINKIDRIIEISVRSGTVKEYELEEEMGLLYDVKRLIDVLPFS